VSVLWVRLRSWCRAVTGRRRLETEMEEEIRFHLEARAADLMLEGSDPRDAMRKARLEFGGVASHKDAMRSSLGLRWWDELWGDLRYGARILRKSPGFTSIAVVSLALAIGANTAIFSLANQLLYAHLGVPHPEQLRLLTVIGDEHSAVHSAWGSRDSVPGGGVRYDSFTYPIYQQLRRENRVLGEIFAFKDNIQANATIDGSARAIQLELVSGNLYEQMGVRPALGRAILPSDDQAPGTGAVATISEGLWERAFGEDPGAIGKVITVNMTPVTVIGVNPRAFTGARSVQSSPDIFMPLSMIPLVKGELGQSGPLLSSSKLWWVQLMAREKPGVPLEEASAALNVAFSSAIHATMTVAKDDTMPRLWLEDGSRGLNKNGREFANPMHVLLAVVGFVLLLACANIANLMLARSSARQREMGVRLALGAGRGRVLRQVLTESLMLAAIGGSIGLLLGYLGRTALPKLLLNSWEREGMNVSFDWRVFSFTAGVTLATGVLFSIAPAWSATRAEIGTAIKDGGKASTRQRKGWSGRTIVAFQVALSTLLVVGAGLFLRTLINLNSIDVGFRADGLVLFDINPPSKQYPAPKDVALHARIEEALRAVPGVDGVTLTDIPLLANSQSSSGFNVEGAPEGKQQSRESTGAMEATVGQDFLSVMGIPMVAGRAFTKQDAEAPQRVAVVNQALVRKYFPHQNPVGRRFTMDDAKTKGRSWLEIVGVCADTRYAHLQEEPPPLHFDLYRQSKDIGGVTYVVRTRMKPDALVLSLRAVVQTIDRNLPLMDVRTQRQQIDSTMLQERVFASLTAAFGILALALACVGIYGIMAYTVSQRTNEIGIRLALGARRGQVRGMVLREAGLLAAFGVLAGVAVALWLGQLVKSMLYGLQPSDPASLVGAAVLLLGVALLAGWVPAMRASRVEPMEALRHE
jgi:predicted permease